MSTISKEAVLNKLFNLSEEERERFETEKIHLDFMADVRDLMDKKGWNKADLARELHTSKSYITQLFRGEKLFNATLVARLNKVLDADFAIRLPSTVTITRVQNVVQTDQLVTLYGSFYEHFKSRPKPLWSIPIKQFDLSIPSMEFQYMTS